MNEKIRIPIAYDGSDGANAALDDLRRAGLPRTAEALVVSVAELWLPPPSSGDESVDASFPQHVPAGLKRLREKVAHAIKEARVLLTEASERVRSVFLTWEIRAEAYAGSPAWEVIKEADKWKPDLIVVGSQGRSALGRFVLGSVSQKIVTEARSSVRVGRSRTGSGGLPLRLLLGVDGSRGAEAAVSAVAKREWPSGTEISVIAVDDPTVPLALGSLMPQVAEWIGEGEERERQWVQKMADASAEHLRGAGLDVSSVVKAGDPKRVLADEAKRRGADCIFVGSTGFSNRLERFLLGSVSAAVVNRADCSVEVVRRGPESA